ncbi:MAG: DNA alkylation repair protein [Candidatus Bathyarchaeota archaeon]|nr:DNA alkylation repair protein [Candidatus Bathyarchaeum sp.]
MSVVSQVRQELQKNVDPNTNGYSLSFFKEEIKSLGIRTHVVNKIGKKLFKQIAHLSKNTIFGYCEELLKSGYIEEAVVAFRWSDFLKKRYDPEDFVVFERWLSTYVSNWAECDTLCNHTLGTFVEKFPEYIEKLKEWTQSQNRWLKRGAAVTLILPARKGLFLDDVLEIADKLLLDGDYLVQKGYGWMLKEASKKHQQQVFDYIINNRITMPRTALRYAIEKMPQNLRIEAMKK